jgi:hypothetical protein
MCVPDTFILLLLLLLLLLFRRCSAQLVNPQSAERVQHSASQLHTTSLFLALLHLLITLAVNRLQTPALLCSPTCFIHSVSTLCCIVTYTKTYLSNCFALPSNTSYTRCRRRLLLLANQPMRSATRSILLSRQAHNTALPCNYCCICCHACLLARPCIAPNTHACRRRHSCHCHQSSLLCGLMMLLLPCMMARCSTPPSTPCCCCPTAAKPYPTL